MKKLIAGIALGTAILAIASVAGAQTAMFNQNLTIGSTGADVVALQNWLVAKGYLTMPVGVAPGYFGKLTASAVAKYQMAKGITPAAGYFGPITRAAVNADGSVATGGTTGGTPGCPTGAIYNSMTGEKCSTGGTTSTGSGREGNLQSIASIGGLDSTPREGDSDQKIYGFKAEAKDSDMTVERTEVDFTVGNTSGASSQLKKYIQSASLWLDGKKLGTIDASDISEDQDTDNLYVFRFTGLKGVISEGNTGRFYVTVDPVDSIDSTDATNAITVDVPNSGIRAVDEAGISDTYDGPTSRTFKISKAEAGDVTVKSNASDNVDKVVTVSENANTDSVSALKFSLKSNSSDNVLKKLTVGFATTSSLGAGVSLEDIINNVHLFANGKEIDSDSVTATSTGGASVQFTNFDDVAIDNGDQVDFEVKVDLNSQKNNYAEGAAFHAYVVGTGMTVEDSQGDTVDMSSQSTKTGGDLELRLSGLSVDLVSQSVTTIQSADPGTPGSADKKQFNIAFKVTANGKDDVYLDKSVQLSASPSVAGAGFAWATTTDSDTHVTDQGVASIEASGDTADDSTNNYKIASGDSRTFTLHVTLTATSSGYTAVRLTGINFSTSDTASDASYYTFHLDNFKTDKTFLVKD